MRSLNDALPPTFTAKIARELGVHPRELYAWRDAGQITELSRGVYRRADAPPASYPDILAVAYRVPLAIVCCLSAAVIHDLTDELPGSVQVAVPNDAHPPQIGYPPATVFRFDAETFELGLSAADAAPGELVRVYDAARTVTDLMRLRHRFGEPIAHTALNRYLAQPGSRPKLLLSYARALGVFGPMRTAVDIASAR
jgi:predicted transcriptional regulator of viral defense system